MSAYTKSIIEACNQLDAEIKAEEFVKEFRLPHKDGDSYIDTIINHSKLLNVLCIITADLWGDPEAAITLMDKLGIEYDKRSFKSQTTDELYIPESYLRVISQNLLHDYDAVMKVLDMLKADEPEPTTHDNMAAPEPDLSPDQFKVIEWFKTDMGSQYASTFYKIAEDIDSFHTQQRNFTVTISVETVP